MPGFFEAGNCAVFLFSREVLRRSDLLKNLAEEFLRRRRLPQGNHQRDRVSNCLGRRDRHRVPVGEHALVNDALLQFVEVLPEEDA